MLFHRLTGIPSSEHALAFLVLHACVIILSYRSASDMVFVLNKTTIHISSHCDYGS